MIDILGKGADGSVSSQSIRMEEESLRMSEIFFTQSTHGLFVPDVELSSVNYSAVFTRPRLDLY